MTQRCSSVRNSKPTWLDQAFLLCIFNHVLANAVLHTSAGLHSLQLASDFGPCALADVVQVDHGGVADEVCRHKTAFSLAGLEAMHSLCGTDTADAACTCDAVSNAWPPERLALRHGICRWGFCGRCLCCDKTAAVDMLAALPIQRRCALQGCLQTGQGSQVRGLQTSAILFVPCTAQ